MCVEAQDFVGVVCKITLDFLGHILPGCTIDRSRRKLNSPRVEHIDALRAEVAQLYDAGRLQILHCFHDKT